MVTRTWTSVYRALEAATWFRDDFRVALFFTVHDGSAFSAGVPELLRASKVPVIEWDRIRDGEFEYDLALTASENIDFSAIRTHTILLAHGLGFNKLIGHDPEGPPRVAGLPPAEVLESGDVTVVLSHPEQREQLRPIDPAGARYATVAGDPTLDRLLASRALRPRYRESFGSGNRTVVAIASTWGGESAIGRRHTLPAQLLGELPADTHQVLLVLHPNVWAYHSRFQIELWLASALDAGLILLPPESGWHAALIAADVVISDHGSLALYAAALGKPLLTTGPAAETVPGTPADDLVRHAPRLHPGNDLREQLEQAVKDHRADRYDHITSRVFTGVGHAAAEAQRLIYRQLGLEPPADAVPVTRIPVPHCTIRQITAYVVRAVPVDANVLEIVRYPASVSKHLRESDIHESHLVADETERDPRILERAAAITRDSEPAPPDTAESWACAVLSAYPGAGCAVTVTASGFLAVRRDGAVLSAASTDARPEHVQLIASALYSAHSSRTPLSQSTIRAGATVINVSFRTIRPGRSSGR